MNKQLTLEDVKATANAMALVVQVAAPAKPVDPPTDGDGRDFDWSTDDSVALRSQPATAIYRNADAALVIRQEREWYQEEDSFIRISPENLDAFLDKLTDVAGIPSVGKPRK